ncbi:thioredoxin domain-containing protein [Citricoccus nitrophenolicus]|uniref:Protein-disulfide isomerase n=1 Tax=Citricoccus muralis TaxID=169134 RepID=A0A3D9LAU7_9MICC|nr:thioredoxin domain-containing protein [Citricoccus muralis]REE03242.1 protein-disulfide isomerase [Citricoccus muralis]
MSTGNDSRKKRTWVVPAVLVAVAVLLVGTVIVSALGGTGSTGAAEPSAPAEPAPTRVEGLQLSEAERHDPEDLLAAGPVDAPVTLVVFSDYQCPFCARWSEETLPLMMEHVDAGDLRIEWRDVNVFGPASERAARASYAAARQGAFWEYHDALFEGGHKRSEAQLSEEALTALAEELGLDPDQFSEDMASEQTAEQIATNEQLGLGLGAYSTPMFVLGGQPIVGAQPSPVFQEAFDQALAAAE